MFLSTISRPLINQSFHVGMRQATYALASLSLKIRYFSTRTGKHHLTHVPHAFPLAEAAKKIVEHDSKRLFAPIAQNTNALVLSEKSSLTASFVPVCGIYASVAFTKYKGQVGKYRYETHYYHDKDGKVHSYTIRVTDWHSVSGTVGSFRYNPYDFNMSIYFGGTYNDRTIEAAVEGHHLKGMLQPFDKDKVDKSIHIDPWTKVDGYGINEANNRIVQNERTRALSHMESVHSWGDEYHLDSVSVRYENGEKSFGLKALMLPVYILAYPRTPIRVLAAISPENKVVMGNAPISSVKVTGVVTLLVTVGSLLHPEIAIPARLALGLASGVLAGLLTKAKPAINSFFENRRVGRIQLESDQFARAPIDHARLEATSNPAESEKVTGGNQTPKLDVGIEYYEVLGLDPRGPVTSEIIRAAYLNKVKEVHPDKGGNTDSTQKLHEARDKFIRAIAESSTSAQGKRHFSTYRNVKNKPAPEKQLQFKEPPRSFLHPKTDMLIDLVLKEKNYEKALDLVQKGVLHPDGHNPQENTLLTEAVKLKDVEGVQFALTQAKCSVDLSCDCPLHNTGLHYWAEGAGNEGGKHRQAEQKIFKLLIEHGATVNIINSAGQTPLDIAKDKAAVSMLEHHGGLRHTTQGGIAGALVQIKGFFGYSPQKRMMIAMKEPEKLTSSTSSATSSSKKLMP